MQIKGNVPGNSVLAIVQRITKGKFASEAVELETLPLLDIKAYSTDRKIAAYGSFAIQSVLWLERKQITDTFYTVGNPQLRVLQKDKINLGLYGRLCAEAAAPAAPIDTLTDLRVEQSSNALTGFRFYAAIPE